DLESPRFRVLDVLLELPNSPVGQRELEAPHLPEPALLPVLRRPVLQAIDDSADGAHHELARAQLADEPGRLWRVPARELAPLEDDDVTQAGTRQVIGDRASPDPAAHDDGSGFARRTHDTSGARRPDPAGTRRGLGRRSGRCLLLPRDLKELVGQSEPDILLHHPELSHGGPPPGARGVPPPPAA